MNPTAITGYLKKAHNAIRDLNRREGIKGVFALTIYFDFIWCFLRYGCLINQYVNGDFWRMKNHDRKKIMTYKRVVQLINKCNKPDSIELLDNKISFNRHFAKYVKRDWLSSEGMTFEQFKVFCKNKEAIIKLLNECEGKGIELIELPDSKNEDAIRKLFDSFKSRGLIIEVRIHNHPDMNFNNHSINTIRINSLTDLNGNTHLFKPVLRAGVGESFVDNYNAGGCEYAIDVESGVIISERYQGYKLNGIYHPGSHIIMPGYRIPLWEDIIKTVKDACRLIPGCRFVGWDVAITPEGIQLIEGNHNPGNVGIEYFGERGWWEKLKKFI